MRTEHLLVEDLMLLLLDDDGASIAGAGTLHYSLGGAVLVELAMLGRVEPDTDGGGVLNGPVITPVGSDPLPDPVLQAAFDRVAEKPTRVQPLLLALGANLWKDVTARLVERGLVREEKRRLLGLFRTSSWPAADTEHEAGVREQIRAALEDGAEPDARTAALIALLSASGTLPALRPRLPWNGDIARRAQQLQRGDWGASAVSTAVARTTAAIAVSAASSVSVAVNVAGNS